MASETKRVSLDMQAQCGCGWKGHRRFLYMNAQDEMIEHVGKSHGLDIKVVHLGGAEVDHGE